MVKKVVLDKLEMEEPEFLSEEKAAQPLEEGGTAAYKLAFPWRWVSMLLVVVGILLIGGGASYWWLAANKAGGRPAGHKIAAAVPSPRRDGLVDAKDFILTLKDDKGNGRVMMCDLTFELYDGQEVRFKKNILEIRKIIYEKVRQKQVFSLLLPERKIALKEELNAELGNLLGKDVVKAIYFSKFVIL